MKVIKKGKTWSKEVKCTGRGNGGGGCGAILLISECDIYHTYDDDYYHDNERTTFYCRECGFETNISVSLHVARKGKRPPEEKIRKKIPYLDLSRVKII